VKVSDLIQKLSQLDPNLEVYCYEEGPVPIQGVNPGPYDIVDASSASVEMMRISGKPMLRFSTTAASKSVAILGITPDF
jgi:hypothetical protein